MYCRWAAVGLLAAILGAMLLAGCGSKTVDGPKPKYAVLRFENLSGDSSKDWTGRAASEVLSRSLVMKGAIAGPVLPTGAIGRMGPNLGTRPAMAPGISSERAAAMAAGANRLITGYIENAGAGLRVTAVEEDAIGGTTLRTVSGTGATAVEALRAVSKGLAAESTAGLTGSEEALKNYATGIEMPLASAGAWFEKAVGADAKLGPAWVALVAAYAGAGDRGGAEQAIARARAVKLDARDLAALELEAANLLGNKQMRLAALRKVMETSPGDLMLQRNLGGQEVQAGEFAKAAAIWKSMVEGNPRDIDGWNDLAYSRAYLGDRAGALLAIRQYVQLRPNEANPLDSEADIHYLFKEYKEAAAGYEAAAVKQPDALGGGEIYKAAWARFAAGDKVGAEKNFGAYAADQRKRGNASLPLLEADWLYRTGRKAEGMEKLRQAAGNPELKSLYLAQLAVWLVMDGQRGKAAQLFTGQQLMNGPAVAAAFFVSRPSGSVAQWTGLAEKMFAGAGNAGFRDQTLAYALILDGHKDAALAVWTRVAEGSAATEFAVRAVLTRLQGKPAGQPLIPNPLQYNQFLGVLGLL